MSIDMEQFKVTFVEESLEGLDIMESVLLDMHPGATDAEAIDNIFRAAHSIKGGAATFGLGDIANFTHVVETLLDEVRNGDRDITQDAIVLFLSSVDCIREMLSADQNGEAVDHAHIEQIKAGLDEMLGSEQESETVPAEDTAPTSSASPDNGWEIIFKPFPGMLRTGNDVVRMFRELAGLGDFTAVVDTENLPPLVDMDPEEAYLSWHITLNGEIDKAQISEIFEWVEDDCELEILPLKGGDTETVVNDITEETSPAELQIASPPPERRVEEDRRQQPARKTTSPESSSIRVGIDKVDDLINMVGELVITQSMLSQLGEDFDMNRVERLNDGLAELERNTRELQESVMRIRMLPISFAFNRFPRMVHDLSAKLDKKIELTMSGEQTELDKTVMEKIGDPLVHLVRNSIDHGIETPEARKAAGKSETGVVNLNAYHQGGNIIIEINDDGAGLNYEKILAKAIERGLVGANEELPEEKVYELLFEPGFSTADVVSDVSGRGVGMDVVKRNIMALGGRVDVKSVPGEGSTFTIRLPLTLAILDGQLVRVGDNTYIIPLVSIVESLLVDQKNVNEIAGKAEVYQLRSDYLPIIRLYEVFGVEPDKRSLDDGLLVVVEGDSKKGGLLVDELLGQQQVVIKSLETNFRRVEGLSGATILGDGTVALIVDVAGVVRLSREDERCSNNQIVAA
ncbi:MAG: chemotaxis protein CheA [Gammaproteobacteria bacterium]|nr:chemotaxis protein CheA [Gammaproteobacteria bacterium]MCF6261035.1 chemotaxis protein CheA [Gammaproteobacteria bacterium]